MAAAALPGSRPARVLVVDDSTTTRMALARLLRRASGWEIAEAGDADAGLDQVQRATEQGKPFDLVLLDVEMPGTSGVEAVPLMLAMRPPPRIIMVASPTRRSAENTFAALRSGASDF